MLRRGATVPDPRAAWFAWAVPASGSSWSRQQPRSLTIGDILRQGHRYQAVLVRVAGFMHVEFEQVAIYASERVYRFPT
jgi:hypothetical protein